MASWLVAKLPGGEMTGYRNIHSNLPISNTLRATMGSLAFGTKNIH